MLEHDIATRAYEKWQAGSQNAQDNWNQAKYELEHVDFHPKAVITVEVYPSREQLFEDIFGIPLSCAAFLASRGVEHWVRVFTYIHDGETTPLDK